MRLGIVSRHRYLRGQSLLEDERLAHCYECPDPCRKGILSKIKPYGFTEFARRFGEEHLLDCLERNEAADIAYHRQGIIGDYDDFGDLEELLAFIETGRPPKNN